MGVSSSVWVDVGEIRRRWVENGAPQTVIFAYAVGYCVPDIALQPCPVVSRQVSSRRLQLLGNVILRIPNKVIQL